MRRQEKPGVFIRTIAGLSACACCVSPAWSHGAEDSHRNRLERTIATDDNYELCMVLAQEQQLSYAYNATQKLDFNIHYHADHTVFYPVNEHQTMDATATFTAKFEREYCLMWTNQGNSDVLLTLEYEKQQTTSP